LFSFDFCLLFTQFVEAGGILALVPIAKGKGHSSDIFVEIIKILTKAAVEPAHAVLIARFVLNTYAISFSIKYPDRFT
jgi:hypothetical protein